ncbi:DUF2812 domain-containing protein [Acetatifactor aquisgranensis]|uniref:DUF2812 domain-containing protein n=1 Tax=Acetatifactor aquisgranensis TaxID=2941233 RepID=UPI0020419366|nr:DUF2812 domain-containing protein [Acetatifactor aquisgranensis]
MSKKCYRYYGSLLVSQANWLNKMAEKGYRLIRTGKMLYEFEECTPGQYQYCVGFIGQMSKESAADYARFLEDVGYRVFFKNINLNWNVGKVVVRPWAEQGGRLATNSTTFNRELLIVEKETDGKPFELHTTYEDKANYCKQMRRPWLYLFLVSVVLGILMRTWVWGVFGAISVVGLLMCQIELLRLNKQAKTKEW